MPMPYRVLSHRTGFAFIQEARRKTKVPSPGGAARLGDIRSGIVSASHPALAIEDHLRNAYPDEADLLVDPATLAASQGPMNGTGGNTEINPLQIRDIPIWKALIGHP